MDKNECNAEDENMAGVAENAHTIMTELALMKRDIQEVKAIAGAVQSALQDDRSGPGLMTRVDRMEQASKLQSWFHGVWATATIGAAVSWLASKVGIHS